MNKKEILTSFVAYAKAIHAFPILDSNIDSLIDGYIENYNTVDLDENNGIWAIGKKVKITDNIYSHDFRLGEVVEIIDKFDYDIWECSDGNIQFFISNKEAVLI